MPKVVLPDGREKRFGEPDADGKYEEKDKKAADKFAKENGGVVVYDYAAGGAVARGSGASTRGYRWNGK